MSTKPIDIYVHRDWTLRKPLEQEIYVYIASTLQAHTLLQAKETYSKSSTIPLKFIKTYYKER